MRRTPSVAVSIVAAALTGMAGQAAASCPSGRTVTVLPTENGKTVQAHPGDYLRILISGPSGTGYV